MNQISQQARVLGVSLTTRGFGYAVIERGNSLVGFGKVRVKGDKNVNSLAGIKRVIARYQPDVLVLQDVNQAKGTKRVPRIKTLHRRVVVLAKESKIKVVVIPGKIMRETLLGNGNATKHEMATLMAQKFPDELSSLLPVKRRTQDNEDPRMDVLDAVGLIVAFLD